MLAFQELRKDECSSKHTRYFACKCKIAQHNAVPCKKKECLHYIYKQYRLTMTGDICTKQNVLLSRDDNFWDSNLLAGRLTPAASVDVHAKTHRTPSR